jgi:hypothetical protein
MLLVVFGAGASYDSDPDHLPPLYDPNVRADRLPPLEHHRPPLANSLFDNRPQFLNAMESFPECLVLISRLRKPGVAVEQELAKFQEQASVYPDRHRQLIAIRFYLRRALWECQDRWNGVHHGVTNYAVLLGEIERWRVEKREHVCFVTFNYDTMLEKAMEVRRLIAPDMDSYPNWRNYSLFKLHGSIDWGRVVEGISRAVGGPIRFYQQLIDANPDNFSVTEKYMLCEREMQPKPDGAEVLFPALSIPVEKKDEFSCPLAHVTALKGLLPYVTKMITIGWRATEEEFLKMLVASRSAEIPGIRPAVELLVVTGSKDGAEQTIKNLADYGANQNLQDPDRARFATGFTGLINNLDTLGTFLRKGLHYA